MELRCENGIKFGEIVNGLFEVKCRSSRCGHEAGVVVLHQFDLSTGELAGTRQFKDISSREEGKQNDKSSLRSA